MDEKETTIKKDTLPALRDGASLFFDVAKFEHAQRVGRLFSESNLVPTHFQGSIGNCVIALNLADRLQVDPFMLVQNMYVVHGRPGIEGKLRIALINGCGRFTPLKFKFEGKGKTDKGVSRPDKCIAYATEKASGEELSVEVSWETVVAEGWNREKKNPKTGYVQVSKWETMPEQMFRYRSAAFFERAYCPEVSLGLRNIEELEDIVDMEPGLGGVYEATKDKAEALKQRLKAEKGEEPTGQEPESPGEGAPEWKGYVKGATDEECRLAFEHRFAKGPGVAELIDKAELNLANHTFTYLEDFLLNKKCKGATVDAGAIKKLKGLIEKKKAGEHVPPPSDPTDRASGEEIAKVMDIIERAGQDPEMVLEYLDILNLTMTDEHLFVGEPEWKNLTVGAVMMITADPVKFLGGFRSWKASASQEPQEEPDPEPEHEPSTEPPESGITPENPEEGASGEDDELAADTPSLKKIWETLRANGLEPKAALEMLIAEGGHWTGEKPEWAALKQSSADLINANIQRFMVSVADHQNRKEKAGGEPVTPSPWI